MTTVPDELVESLGVCIKENLPAEVAARIAAEYYEPMIAACKAAVEFMYETIGRDYGSLEPLEAAKAWQKAVLDKKQGGWR